MHRQSFKRAFLFLQLLNSSFKIETLQLYFVAHLLKRERGDGVTLKAMVGNSERKTDQSEQGSKEQKMEGEAGKVIRWMQNTLKNVF
jgi:hypothetical protein